jgi:hypothetical protein
MEPDPPYGHERYFVLPADVRLVPLERLRPTKPPSSQPESVAAARGRMLDAAEGRIPRRVPLLVRERGDGTFDIVDGNATYGVALAAGWLDLPVLVEPDSPRPGYHELQ